MKVKEGNLFLGHSSRLNCKIRISFGRSIFGKITIIASEIRWRVETKFVCMIAHAVSKVGDSGVTWGISSPQSGFPTIPKGALACRFETSRPVSPTTVDKCRGVCGRPNRRRQTRGSSKRIWKRRKHNAHNRRIFTPFVPNLFDPPVLCARYTKSSIIRIYIFIYIKDGTKRQTPADIRRSMAIVCAFMCVRMYYYAWHNEGEGRYVVIVTC